MCWLRFGVCSFLAQWYFDKMKHVLLSFAFIFCSFNGLINGNYV